jgi:hypothetical protein
MNVAITRIRDGSRKEGRPQVPRHWSSRVKNGANLCVAEPDQVRGFGHRGWRKNVFCGHSNYNRRGQRQSSMQFSSLAISTPSRLDRASPPKIST